MLLVLVCCLCMLLVVTLLPISYSQHYLVRSCDFIRLQVFYLACVALFGACYFVYIQFSAMSLAAVLIAGGILVIQGQWIYPYTWFARKEVASSAQNATHSIRIMSANVLMSNDDYSALIGLIEQHQPDLLITLESDANWQQQLSCLEELYPYRIYCPKDNRYGMHLYSKYKIKQQRVCELVEDDIPSVHVLFENAQGITMQGHFIHPAPPSPTEEDTSRPRDTELIILAKALKNVTRPIIVAGDLNDVAWSRTTRLFMQISDLLDPRKGRGFFNTFHADYFFMRWPLDHLFHSNHFTVKRIKRLAKYGSDHFALLTELVYKPEQVKAQYSTETAHPETIEMAETLQIDSCSKRQVPTFYND
ncbi:endonuclease/exonuclease/phosphatase family protein [Pseudoalteromonas mariniglutinosa]|uniref:endonuclease/exonuclease/phosphatase family protein n=1 Tax=Pseudoalteromonas mariniglutinosa TaxID=206042 RepID=UPI00384A84AC